MSSPTSGNFDCGRRLQIKAMANTLFQDDVRRAEYVPESDTAQMILGMQTANLPQLTQPTKDDTVKAVWVDDCDDEDGEDCAPTCEISGDQLGDNCTDYVLDECKQKAFSVTEEIFRTRIESPEEVAAIGLLKKLLLMDRTVSKAAIQFLDDNAGTNLYDATYNAEYTVAGDTTSIPSAAWNPDLFGYLAKVKAINKLNNMRILDSGRLFRSFWKADMETTNPDGTSNQRKMNSMGNPTFDLFQISPTLGADATFLINPNSAAIFFKSRFSAYGARGRDMYGDFGYQNWSTVASPSLPGVIYDLVFQEKCDNSGGARDVVRSWQVETRFGIFLNPLGCTTGRTGILKLVCTAS